MPKAFGFAVILYAYVHMSQMFKVTLTITFCYHFNKHFCKTEIFQHDITEGENPQGQKVSKLSIHVVEDTIGDSYRKLKTLS